MVFLYVSENLSKNYEEKNYTSDLFGTDSALVKIIYNITKLKYKDKGDPAGIKGYFGLHNIDPQHLVRYVGTRFHVLSELAGNVYFIRDALIDYLNTTCSKGEVYKNQMIKDLLSATVARELVVGGLFGKVLTGPWMTALYRKENITNLDSCHHLAFMESKLESLVDHPRLLFDQSFCCFDLPAERERTAMSKKVHECLLQYNPDEETLKFISTVASEFLVVVRRQAKDYLPGGKFSDMEPEMIVLGKNAPADNIMAETILGLTDNLKRKAPNASDSYITSKVSTVMNKTHDWLKSLPDSSHLLKSCIKLGRNLKKTSIERAEAVKLEIQKRTKEKSQQKSDKDRKKFSKSISEFIKLPQSFKTKTAELDSEIPTEILDFADSVVNNPKSILGRDISWVWVVDGISTVFNYRLTKVKSKKRAANYVTVYGGIFWTEGQTFDDAETCEVPLSDVVADLLMSDLWLQ